MNWKLSLYILLLWVICLISIYIASADVIANHVVWSPDEHIQKKAEDFATVLSALDAKPFVIGKGLVGRDHKAGPEIVVSKEGLKFTHDNSQVSVSWDGNFKKGGIDVESFQIPHVRMKWKDGSITFNDLFSVKCVTQEDDVKIEYKLTEYSGQERLADTGTDNASPELDDTPKQFSRRISEEGRVKQCYLSKREEKIIFQASVHIGSITEGMLWYIDHNSIVITEAEILGVKTIMENLKAYRELERSIFSAKITRNSNFIIHISDGLKFKVTQVDLNRLKSIFLFFPPRLDMIDQDGLEETFRAVLEQIKERVANLDTSVKNFVSLFAGQDDVYILETYCDSLYSLIREWNHFNTEILTIDGLKAYYSPELVRVVDDRSTFHRVRSVELVGEDCEFKYDDLKRTFGTVIDGIKDDNYQIVSIMGEQSTGKSTLLSFLFNAQFVSKISTRHAETIGISMSQSALVFEPDSFRILLQDGEGLFGMDIKESTSTDIGAVETTRTRNMYFCLATTTLSIFRMKFADIETGEQRYAVLKRVLGIYGKYASSIHRKCHILFIFQDSDQDEVLIQQKSMLFSEKLDDITDPQHRALFSFSYHFVVSPRINMPLYLNQVHYLSVMIHSGHYGRLERKNTLWNIAESTQRFFGDSSPYEIRSLLDVMKEIIEFTATIRGEFEVMGLATMQKLLEWGPSRRELEASRVRSGYNYIGLIDDPDARYEDGSTYFDNTMQLIKDAKAPMKEKKDEIIARFKRDFGNVDQLLLKETDLTLTESNIVIAYRDLDNKLMKAMFSQLAVDAADYITEYIDAAIEPLFEIDVGGLYTGMETLILVIHCFVPSKEKVSVFVGGFQALDDKVREFWIKFRKIVINEFKKNCKKFIEDDKGTKGFYPGLKIDVEKLKRAHETLANTCDIDGGPGDIDILVGEFERMARERVFGKNGEAEKSFFAEISDNLYGKYKLVHKDKSSRNKARFREVSILDLNMSNNNIYSRHVKDYLKSWMRNIYAEMKMKIS